MPFIRIGLGHSTTATTICCNCTLHIETKRQRHAAQTLYCTLLHWSTSVDYILVESYTMPKDQEKELWLHGAALCLPEYIAHVLPGQWTSRNSQTAKLVSIEILQIFFLRFFIDTIQLFGSWFRRSGSGSLQPSQQEELALIQVGQKASCWAYEIVQSQVSGISTWVDPFSPHKIVQSVRRLFGMLVIQLRNSCKSPKCSFKLQQTQVVQERANCRLTCSNLENPAQGSRPGGGAGAGGGGGAGAGPSCDLQSGSSILGFRILNPENLKMCNF